jgi:hypothetical protein
MEHVVSRVLGTFAFGFTVIGGILGLLPIGDSGDCGSLFNNGGGCGGTNSRLALVVLVFGIALTCFVAWSSLALDNAGEEEPPTIYPDGAQV